MIITAIHLAKTRKAWSDEYTYVPMAWVRRGDGEEFIQIDQGAFDRLLGMATEGDYREYNRYVAFAEAVELPEEPDDLEWMTEMNAGYMRDIGAGIQRWTR